jgi:DNA-binding transcriptional regulator YdaS (Cro superfamily)
VAPCREALTEAIRVLGSQTALAARLGVKTGHVYYWLNAGRIPYEFCPAVERATRELGAVVTCERLRDDIDWVRLPAPGWPAGKPLIDVTVSSDASVEPEAA